MNGTEITQKSLTKFIFLISLTGWWATGHEVTNHSSVIHEYYARECNNPIHLTVDTSLQGGRMGLKAYVCVNLGIPGGKSGCMFTPINSEVTCYEPEVRIRTIFPTPAIQYTEHCTEYSIKLTHFQVVGLQLCEKTVGVTNPNRPKTISPMLDLAQVAEASGKLLTLLEQTLAYVEDVLSNKQPPDNAVGRSLLDLIHSVPHMSPEQFAQMFNSNIKDLLMVITLSQLIKTQLQLNEKLTFFSTIGK